MLTEITERYPGGALTLPEDDDGLRVRGFLGHRGQVDRLERVPDDGLVPEALGGSAADWLCQGEVWQLLCDAIPRVP